MSKQRFKRHAGKRDPQPVASGAAPAGMEVFTFGEPVPVLDRREILDLLECPVNGKWFEPPVSLEGLARTYRAAVHHGSAIQVKRNILVSCFKPHPLLSQSDFSRFALEFLVFGNGYLERVQAVTGKVLGYRPTLAKYTRRGVDMDTYWFLPGGQAKEHQFKPGQVFHLFEPDLNQEIYGVPDYLAANNSTWLNESATLFRRKYYLNGSHAGVILYLTDPAHKQEDVDALRTAMKNSRGPGNFRNMFLHAPNGKKDGLQVIPLSEVAAKDEFLGIKNVTRDDQLAAHRVPPQMMGIIPNNTGGFGDVAKAAEVFVRNELVPLQNRMRELNAWAGMNIVDFEPYTLAGMGAA